MTLSAGTHLGPYEILASIGAGGMGEVYRARDKKLDRDVAIKVLPPSFAHDPEMRARFEREAKAVASLSHPHILAIHDFGIHDGHAYAVMELLKGETLRGKLDAGPIPYKQAIDYALQVARGLSGAHEQGVVHRDLKPENVFVTREGHVKILDFGLAKRVEVVDTEGETGAPAAGGLTAPGAVMGTAGYMSPEQVRGLPVDARSDIFAFGAILYELLSGRRAFKRESAIDSMMAILKEEPPELGGSGQNVPPALEHVVAHCLEKERENRFQSARDIVFALSEASSVPVTGPARVAAQPFAGKRRILAAAAAVAVLAAVGVVLVRRSHVGTGGVKRVAVLPFENLGSPETDYFADGISDEIRGKLTSLPGLVVIARGSSTPYKKTTKTPKQIAEELNAPYLLGATVRWEKSGGVDRVHVSPELVDVTDPQTPASKWQQPFDAALTDVFQVQSDIASRVAQALGVALGTGDQKRISEKPTGNLAAYDVFLKGEEASKGMAVNDPPTLRKAIGLYDQAVALDPGFAQAWARLSQANSTLFANGAPLPEFGQRARQAAEKAVALAPDRPEGYLAFGTYERFVSHDSARALEQYAKGMRVVPGNAELLTGTARAEQALGRWEAAVDQYRNAERVDPRSVVTLRRLGEALLWLRRYPEARETLDRALGLAPANLTLIEDKAMTFLGEGDLAGARTAIGSAPREVDPDALVAYVASYFDLVWALDGPHRQVLLRLTPAPFDDDRGMWGLALAQACALQGDAAGVRAHAEDARKAYEEQVHAAPGEPGGHMGLGVALAYLGRKEDAIREGESGVTLSPLGKDAVSGPYYQHQLVRIYVLVGEPGKAVDRLAPILKVPYLLSPGWLRIDPNFDPLRGDPGFQKLASVTK